MIRKIITDPAFWFLCVSIGFNIYQSAEASWLRNRINFWKNAYATERDAMRRIYERRKEGNP
jgi:hypothetical protein